MNNYVNLAGLLLIRIEDIAAVDFDCIETEDAKVRYGIQIDYVHSGRKFTRNFYTEDGSEYLRRKAAISVVLEREEL